MTHLGIAMFDGVRDRLLSEEIRPYIFGGQPDIQAVDWNSIWNAKGALTASPPMYACAVPLLPSTTFGVLSGLTVTTASLGINISTIPAGTYYALMYMQDAQGKFYKSAEFGPLTVSTSQAFSITLTPLPLTGINYFFAYGPTPGGENMMVPLNPGLLVSSPSFITSPGFASLVPFTSGSMLTRLLCYDLVLKGWIIIDLPFAISSLKQIRSPGTIPLTLMAGFSDMGIRRWQAGESTWDAGAVNAGAPDNIVHYSVRSPEVFGKDASDRVYFRQLEIRGRGTPNFKAQFTVNGVAGLNLFTQNVTVLPMGGGEFVAYAEIGVTGIDSHVDVTGSGPIEIDSFDWLAVAKAIRGRVLV
jgi:hypothetical protein